MRKYENKDAKGFTVLELVISMAMGAVILTALVSTFVLQRERYDVQDQYKDMAYTARAAMDMISRDVSSAGYNPTGDLQGIIYPESSDGKNTPFVGIPYNANVLEIISDLNGDNDIVDDNERIRYKYDSSLMQIQRSVTPIGETDEWYAFAENVQAFDFKYFKADTTEEVTSAADQKYIRSVQVSITARAEDKDADFSDNGGYRSTTLLSDVKIRNLGLKKASPSTTVAGTSTTTEPGATTTSSSTSSTSTTSTADPGIIEGNLELTTTEGFATSTTTTEGIIETTTIFKPTDCTVHFSVGTCISANNNGEVYLRVHILDYKTFEPVENAVVNWAIWDKDKLVQRNEQGELLEYYNGWYGGSDSCSECWEGGVYIGCAKSLESIYKNGYYQVEIEINLEGCGGGIFTITPDTEEVVLQ